MFAIFGTAGSAHHAYRHVSTRAQGEEWLAEYERKFNLKHPAAIGQSCRVLPDRVAEVVLYADGSRVYRKDEASDLDVLDGLTPAEAWDTYVGADSPRDYSDEDIERYVTEAPTCEGLNEDERGRLYTKLLAYKAAQQS